MALIDFLFGRRGYGIGLGRLDRQRLLDGVLEWLPG